MKNFSLRCNLFPPRFVLLAEGSFKEPVREIPNRLIGKRGVFVKPSTEKIFAAYKDRLFSIAYTICQNREDAEDVMQDTLIRYCAAKREFESEEHIKAWLIRVAINRAKDLRASFWRRNKSDWEEGMATLPFEEPADGLLFQAVMGLEEKYRIVVHMFYYEDYDIAEIARILGCPGGTVKSRLSRARRLLKTQLKEDWNND